ncbi:serine protease [Desulfobotulus sp. H1]|uniref:Serine protease n=1 Tax=Desulfobotulus pelophilus TaxID=2823377 RepID=A0ABT3N9E5_9BACT|nr:serine protease [Desulfobotulus pelophilus]MCW7754089.1 serine protease [Desulfobotulus pelophilus]
MSLQDHYASIRPGIFAFIPKYRAPGQRGPLPPIIGTGFLVREDGLAMTNAHVINAFREVFRPDGIPDSDWCIQGLFLVRDKAAMMALRIDVAAVLRMDTLAKDADSTKQAPDIGLVHMAVSETPFLDLEEHADLQEGMTVATAGFPSGKRALESPAGIQLGPTLQKGIISAIIPFPKPKPSAFAISVMSHGGASGSPVFDPHTGKTLGLLFSSLQDVGVLDQGTATYAMPTSITYAVPGHYLVSALSMAPCQLPCHPSFNNRVREHKNNPDIA